MSRKNDASGNYTKWPQNTLPDNVKFIDNRVRFFLPRFPLLYRRDSVTVKNDVKNTESFAVVP